MPERDRDLIYIGALKLCAWINVLYLYFRARLGWLQWPARAGAATAQAVGCPRYHPPLPAKAVLGFSGSAAAGITIEPPAPQASPMPKKVLSE